MLMVKVPAMKYAARLCGSQIENLNLFSFLTVLFSSMLQPYALHRLHFPNFRFEVIGLVPLKLIDFNPDIFSFHDD